MDTGCNNVFKHFQMLRKCCLTIWLQIVLWTDNPHYTIHDFLLRKPCIQLCYQAFCSFYHPTQHKTINGGRSSTSKSTSCKIEVKKTPSWLITKLWKEEFKGGQKFTFATMDYVTFYIITFASLCASCTIIANVPCVTSNLAFISKQTTPQWTHIFSPFITKARFSINAICILINNPFQMDLIMVTM